MAVVIDGTSGISSPDYEVDGVTGQIYPLVSGTAVTASGPLPPWPVSCPTVDRTEQCR